MKKVITNSVKRLVLIFVLGLSSVFPLAAQSPNLINYQTVVRDSYGNILSNQIVSLRISILQGSMTGTTEYVETHNDTTNLYGLLALRLGGGSPQYGTFSSINWANGPYYIKVELDQAGGTSYTVMGITQMVSVPYALYAEKANVPGVPGPTGAQGPAGSDGASGDQYAT
ncbi:MAG TPA: collagen-like protein, partial [Bacteroidales bacterium]|nr:collagen-like protein [Bacteroidales bacterium]